MVWQRTTRSLTIKRQGEMRNIQWMDVNERAKMSKKNFFFWLETNTSNQKFSSSDWWVFVIYNGAWWWWVREREWVHLLWWTIDKYHNHIFHIPHNECIYVTCARLFATHTHSHYVASLTWENSFWWFSMMWFEWVSHAFVWLLINFDVCVAILTVSIALA